MSIKRIFIGIIMVVTLASCGTEFKLAKSFTEQSQNTRVAVFFPEMAQVTLVQDKEGNYSKVLDSLNQNMFLDIVYAAYADALRHNGLDVYIPDDPDRVQVDSTHWLVILSKMEIQGMHTEYVDHLFDFLNEYDYSFSLNTVNVASWFDVNDGEWHPTLFDEYNLRDDFRSYVTRSRENGTQYHYEITPLNADDIYNYAVFLGKRYAELTYDHMMNHSIETALAKKNLFPRFKLHWNPGEKTYEFLLEGEGFIELVPDSQSPSSSQL